jgi:hypothetical protein
MLSRLVIGPEFNNNPGGECQTETLLCSLPIEEPVGAGPALGAEQMSPAGAPQTAGWEQEPFLGDYLPAADSGYGPAPYAAPQAYEPHPYADYEAPAPQPVPAAHRLPPPQPMRAPEPEYADLASRAADLAARVASLMSANAGSEQSLERYETQTTNLSSFLAEGDRAEAARRTAARFAGNSARGRTTGQRPVADEHGTRRRNT